ncbi:MAG: MaoC family dehydratase [Hyphomicrobiaceae bacterium]|nr:MaoC family dehydratase [Hyphomicrobiaceae bacterium]
MQHFEDFPQGRTIDLGARSLDKEAIIAFARLYDPQPFHLDEAAAEKSAMKGLSASGWHSCCLFMQMMCEGFLLDTAGLGSPGVDRLRWLKPVRPDTTLRGTATVLDARRSSSDPSRGIVRFLMTLDQDGETAMTFECAVFITAREAAQG